MAIDMETVNDLDALIKFRLEANGNTYAASLNEVPSTRINSHDFHYESGEYTYRSRVTGSIAWFQGYEEIWRGETRVYECCFHGGLIQ